MKMKLNSDWPDDSPSGLAVSRRLFSILLLGLLMVPSTGCGKRRPLNVLLITIDTLRADHLGCYGFNLAHTPRIDRLAREGVRATDAVAAAPITLPSHASILTGLLPPAHGVRDNGTYALGDDAVTLAERLKAAGYSTHAAVSALVLNRRYNLAQGFDSYDDDLWAEDAPRLFMIRDRRAAKTAERVAGWLDTWSEAKTRRPFFVWTHFYDPHQPYEPLPEDRVRCPTPYDGEIAGADKGVGRIVDELERLGVLDDTLVILTADHGESLGEHGEKTHAVFVYDATLHVPFLLRSPRLFSAGTVYTGPVRSVDIVPTVLSALGLPGGEETQGADLLRALQGKAEPLQLPQYSESLLAEVGFGMAPLYAVRSAGIKWIRAPRPEVYDLKKDPHELHNLYPQEARRGARLDRELSALLADSQKRALGAQKSPMDRETLENLQALGYLAPAGMRQTMKGIDPKDGIVLYNKLEEARHFAQGKQWPEAERKLREIMEVTPANLSALNILALCRFQQDDLPGAYGLYLRSLALDPKQSRVYAMLGAISMIREDFAAAERNYRQALAITPAFVEAMSSLGFIAAVHGKDGEAQRWYEKAIAADPGFPRVYRRLGDLYYERGDWDKAFVNYRKTIRIIPSDFTAVVQAGNAARRKGDRKGAAELFRQAARLRPDSWVPVYNLACLRAVEGDLPAALELLGQLPGKGFHNPGLLEADEDLKALRGSPELRRIIAAVEAAAEAR